MKHPQLSVIATGPSGFPGASQIMCQYLRELAMAGCNVHYVGFQQPFMFRFVSHCGVQFHVVKPLTAGAIGDGKAIQSPDVLFAEQLAERILDLAIQISSSSPLLIWGTYILPYGRAALCAQQWLSRRAVNSQLWITPTGSDVWEIGGKLEHITASILTDPHVNRIITYTTRFASEIKELFNLQRVIDVVYPIIDTYRFHPVGEKERSISRKKLGISDDSFVITSHSNMRPVKAPEDVIHIACGVAKIAQRPVVLLLIGPKPILPNFDTPPNLEIRCAGVIEQVERYLQISDIELNCSWHDSFNLSLAEAMACAIPCATTDVVGISPEIERSNGGILFPLEDNYQPGNHSEVRYKHAISAIAELAAKENIRRQRGQAAYRHVNQVFSSRHILPHILNLALNSSQ